MSKQIRKKKYNSKGAAVILLPVVMMFVIVSLYILALSHHVEKNLRDTGLYAEENIAYAAAVAGVRYAKTRTEQNFAWEGSNAANNISMTYGDKIVTITENWNGNNKCVRGEIRRQDNKKPPSYFYITFEYLPDISKYVSYNRIGKIPVQGADLHTTKEGIETNKVLIVVKGVCNRQTVYVEAGFTLGGFGGATAPAIASDKIDITMKDSSSKLTVDANNLMEPMICSNKYNDSAAEPSVKIKNGSADFNGGKIVTWGNYVDTAGVSSNAEVQKLTRTNIENLEIDDVVTKLGSVNPSSPVPLMAGEYTFAAPGQLLYKINGVVRKVYTPGEAGAPTYGSERLDGLKMSGTKLTVTKPQTVTVTSEGVSSLIINGASGLTSRVKVVEENQAYILNNTSGGDVKISGEVSGDGSIVAKGDMEFQGKSAMNTTVDAGVSIFAGGNIRLDKVPAGTPDQDVDYNLVYDASRPNSFATRFVNIGRMFYEDMGGGNLGNSYTTIKRRVIDRAIPELRRRDTDSQRKTTYRFKNYAENFLSSNFSDSDYNFFRLLLAQDFEVSTTDSVFYGLIYTKKNFYCYVDGSFTLIGSLIVNSSPPYGQIFFRDARAVNFIYDSSYLSIFQNLASPCTLIQKFENKVP